jgi:hypothetical protein
MRSLSFHSASSELATRRFVRIDVHVSAARQLGLISGSFDVLAAHCVDFGGPAFELALDRQSHLQVHGDDQLDEKNTDGGINHVARNGLTDLTATTDELLLANVTRFAPDIAAYLVVLDSHAIAANAAQHSSLQQRRPLARRPASPVGSEGAAILDQAPPVGFKALPVDVAGMRTLDNEFPLLDWQLDDVGAAIGASTGGIRPKTKAPA